jgi:hypothetical protein
LHARNPINGNERELIEDARRNLYFLKTTPSGMTLDGKLMEPKGEGPPRRLRVVEWVSIVPAIAICTTCADRFTVPVAALAERWLRLIFNISSTAISASSDATAS